jgi:hypothetical protein
MRQLVSNTQFKILSYANAIDQLRVAHRRGLLAPFVGSGLSAPKLRLWPKLVQALAREAMVDDIRLGNPTSDQQLILASERIVWELRARGRPLSDAT